MDKMIIVVDKMNYLQSLNEFGVFPLMHLLIVPEGRSKLLSFFKRPVHLVPAMRSCPGFS